METGARKSDRQRWDRRSLLLALTAPAAGAGLPRPPATAPKPAAPKPAGPEPVWSLAFHPDGKRLAVGGYASVRLFDLTTGTCTRTLSGLAGQVRSLTFSPKGDFLAAGCGWPGVRGEALVWNGEEMQPVLTSKEHKDVVDSLAFMPDGRHLLTASPDERALAVALPAGTVTRALGDHTNRVTSVSVSASGKYVATGSLDQTVKIWNGADFKPLANLDRNGGPVHAVVFVGEILLVAGEDGNLRSWRLGETRTGSLTSVSGNLQRTFNGDRSALFALAAAGNLAVVGGAAGWVSLYDLNSGGRRQQWKESSSQVYSLAVAPNGSQVAAGSRDGQVRIWSTSDGKPVTSFANLGLPV